MTAFRTPLWATGPGEILRHGVALLSNDTDSNRRLALISIDNAVELMLKTYITLPARVTNLRLTRKERDEICQTFPSLLDGIEQYASQKIIGLDLGEIEWFHRLRNDLYHQGNGLTVVRSQVELYAEIAQKLFSSLFDVTIDVDDTSNMQKFGSFMDSWIGIEKALVSASNGHRRFPSSKVTSELVADGKLTIEQATELEELRKVRNDLVHGNTDPKSSLNKNVLEGAKRLSEILAALI